ncbi:unnamed protein product [Larinioides sclopetarius]|uniref:Uncharacterized protein n=1 Tax=Larinioides sclopetarius TaxID=280406 RepID=A0AAV1Z3I1_9ARAC
MNLGNSNLNPSSLIDLKAELHKKYDSLRKAKLDQKLESENRFKPTPFKNKFDTNKDKKQKPGPLVKKPKEDDSEEDLALKKSQSALEAKAKLYEKIVSNQILIANIQMFHLPQNRVRVKKLKFLIQINLYITKMFNTMKYETMAQHILLSLKMKPRERNKWKSCSH